jgi:hypothetical protein
LLLLLIGCKNDPNNFVVGGELVDVNSDVIISDTTKINAYTIKSDSIVTSGVSTVLVGRYQDGNFGNITASSYFRFAVPGLSKVNVNGIMNTVCDSVSLILKSSRFSYGDTTLPYSIEVHQLSDYLDNYSILNGYRYNTSVVHYKSGVLGRTTFVPRPGINPRTSISFSDSIKEYLFSLITKQLVFISDYAQQQTVFLQNFQGVALMPPANGKSSSVLGFSAASSSLYLLFYISTNGVKDTLAFSLTNPNLLYNRIEDDVKSNNSPLSQLTSNQLSLSSLKTGDVTYCQAGTGFMTKLEFPYLQNILMTSNHIRILNAQLLLYPLIGSYKTVPLPTKFQLYQTQDINQLGGLVNDTTKSQLHIDNQFGDQTAYYIDITNFITNFLQTNSYVTPSLIVTFSYKDNSTSLKRVIFSDGLFQVNSTRLRITYWRY